MGKERLRGSVPDGGTVIALLGPPRSGSSAIMRGLACLGVHLGADVDLRTADANNPEGFWEDKRVLAICEGLMDALGMRWDSLRMLQKEDFDTTVAREYAKQASRVVADAVANSPACIWGLKNPRMARMPSLWMNAFAAVGCLDRYVVSLRNPLSVANSIIRGSPHRGSGCGPTYLHLVWLIHMVGALAPAMAGKPTVVVDYDLVMARPAVELRRIAVGIGLSDKCDPAAMDRYGAEFLKGGLRHAAFSPGELDGDPLVPPLVRDAYAIAMEAATDVLPVGSDPFRIRWQKILDDVAGSGPLLRLLEAYESKLQKRNLLAAAVYRRLPVGVKRLIHPVR